MVSHITHDHALPFARAVPEGESASTPNARAGFTLLELLVVIVIIGILATVGLPAIKGMTKSNAIIAANRQLLDDLAYARQRAIADHTTVYVVFASSGILQFDPTKMSSQSNAMTQLLNLYGGQYTTYALLSLRSVGDQPGQGSPHYLTAWRSLPNGIFINTNKFDPAQYRPNPLSAFSFYSNAFPTDVKFPFPVVTTNGIPLTMNLPYLGFDYLGQLVSTNNLDEAIPLTRGSIFYQRDAKGNYINAVADVQETPPGNSVTLSNVIHISWLTGRARVERQEVQ